MGVREESLSTSSIVETSNGKVRGTVAGGVHVFRGVRYGDDTSGANRFRAPQPPKRWSGVVDATAFGASAPQLSRPENTDPFFSWYSQIQPVSEDCLFLNVFTSGLGRGKRPVMVWIHGGGWREYSGTAPGFDGTRLAGSQDVVVVTLNHRLGAFGFLYLEGADERFADSGNAGLLDIVMALEWIRDNADAFGGDPDNVTLFGESGGASKIAAILAMKRAKGLFHRAIVQSSAGGLALASQEDAACASFELARALDRDRVEANVLQGVGMADLLAALRKCQSTFRGMKDQRYFDSDPFGTTAPRTAAEVSVMAGCTNTETTYYLRGDSANFSLGFAEVRKRLSLFLMIDDAAVRRLVDAYRSTYPGHDASGILIAITSDYVFKRNTYRIAALQAASSRRPVYTYLFERETPVEGGRLGSPHTSEVPFVFGTTTAAAAHVGRDSSVEPLSRAMMAAWAAFARTGSPGNPHLPAWQPFDGERRTMILNTVARSESDPGGVARRALDELPFFGYGHRIPAFAAG